VRMWQFFLKALPLVILPAALPMNLFPSFIL
jgi:hypothetical protein